MQLVVQTAPAAVWRQNPLAQSSGASQAWPHSPAASSA